MLIFGTTLGSWRSLAIAIAKNVHLQGEDPYEAWHRELFGGEEDELKVGLDRLDSERQKLEIPARLESEIENIKELGSSKPWISGVSVFGCWTADFWLKKLPSAQGLIFYDHPSRMLLRAMENDSAPSIQALLSVWAFSAQCIISTIRRHRGRILLLNTTECLMYEDHYLEWLQKHLEINPDREGKESEVSRKRTFLEVMAEKTCSENSRIGPLIEELDAWAQPISDEWPSAASKEQPESASAVLIELMEMVRRNKDLAAMVQEGENNISQLETRITGYNEFIGVKEVDAVAAQEKLFLELNQAFQESEQIFELQKVTQEELNRLRQQLGEFQERVGDSEAARILALKEAAAREAFALAEVKKNEMLLHKKGTENRLQAQRIMELENQKEKYNELLLRNKAETAGIQEIVFANLQNAFQESEYFFEKYKLAELLGERLHLTVESIIRDDISEQSEHRHINYTFRQVRIFGRHWPTLSLRLVQHLGRVGLAIFFGHSGKPPLSIWEPTGSENEVPYMLFVPTDMPARKDLARATTSDLIFIRDSISLILLDLLRHRLPEKSRTLWTHLCKRLLQEIDELPDRLRYDSVEARLKPENPQDAVGLFDVLNASFRGIVLPRLQFSWCPTLEEGQLIITLSDPANPPLSYWPEGVNGAPVESLNIRSCWNKFTHKDKAFLQMVVSEIPSFLALVSRQNPANEIELERLKPKVKFSQKLRQLSLGYRDNPTGQLYKSWGILS